MKTTEQRLVSNVNRAMTREQKLYRAMYPEQYGASGMSIVHAVRLHYLALQAVSKANRELRDWHRENDKELSALNRYHAIGAKD